MTHKFDGSCKLCRRPASVQPCDEYTEDRKPVRTWDVWHHGACVAAGFRTRVEARAAAAAYNRERADTHVALEASP